MIDVSSLKSAVRVRLDAIWTRHRAISRQRRELADSSDRTLAEMGIARGDIGSVVHGRFGQA